MHLAFDNYSTKDGLSQATILCSLQDEQAYLWFGTADGLNRFDGYEFEIFRHNPKDPNSLIDNEIMALAQDSSKYIWIGTASGLNRLNTRTGDFDLFQHDANQAQSLSNNYISCLFSDRQNRLWVGTQNGLNLYLEARQQFKRIAFPKQLSTTGKDLRINSICQHPDGTLLVGSEIGLFRLVNERLELIGDGQKVNAIKAILCDKKGNIWIGGTEGLKLLEANALVDYEEVQRLGLIIVESLVESKHGDIWIGTDNGLIILADGNVHNYQVNARPHLGLSNKVIYTLLEDDCGIIWLGTGSGLSKFDPLLHQFHTTRISDYLTYDFTKNKIWAIRGDNQGTIWLGTEAGLYSMGEEKAMKKKYEIRSERNTLTTISSIVIQGDKLWLGSWGNGLIEFFPGTQKVRYFKKDSSSPNSLSSNNVRSLFLDEAQILWVGTEIGLNRYNPVDQSFKTFYFNTKDKNNFKANTIVSIYQDDKHLLWLGTEGGLVCFDKTNETYQLYKHDSKNPGSISHNFIRSILQSEDGTLWVGTSGGLNQWNPETQDFSVIRMQDGLPNDVIYSIQEDEAKNLWLSTNKGLACFNPYKDDFLNFNINDGLQSNEFNTNSSWKSRDGELYFGGINGLNHFHPEEIKTNPNVPQVLIQSVDISTIDGETRIKDWLEEEQTLRLQHSDYSFSINFVALNYTNPEKNRYEYMLEGFDMDWKDADFKRTATYTNLRRGNYTFKVRASNNSGLWNKEGAQLPIHIQPPFWLTDWFLLLASLSFVGLVLLIVQIRTNSIRRKNEELEALVVERTKNLREQKVELEKRESLFRSFYEESPLGIAYIEKHGQCIARCNETLAQMLGYSVAEVEGKTVREFTYPEDLEADIAASEAAIAQKKERLYRRNKRLVRKDGSIVYTSAYLSFVWDENGELDYQIILFNDETEERLFQERLQQVQAQLIQSDKMASLGQLTAGVAHEINNPVNFIYSGIDALKKNIRALLGIFDRYENIKSPNEFEQTKPEIEQMKEQVDFEEVLEDINGLTETIKDGAWRTAEIVKSLQAFSRKDKGAFQMLQIHDGLQSTLRILKEQIKDNLSLQVKYDETIPEIEGNPGQLNQTFLNILMNAIQAIGDQEGMIKISTQNADKNIYVLIEDNGPGIPKAVLSRIFEPFFTTKEVGQGTGLGLSISYGIIEKHQGKIEVESKQGKGTRFKIILPKRQEPLPLDP